MNVWIALLPLSSQRSHEISVKSCLIECAIWLGPLIWVGFHTYNTSDKEEKSKECIDGFGVYKKVNEFVGFVFFICLICLFRESILIDQLLCASQVQCPSQELLFVLCFLVNVAYALFDKLFYVILSYVLCRSGVNACCPAKPLKFFYINTLVKFDLSEIMDYYIR